MDRGWFDIQGKVAVVTGASKGLGRAMAVGLAKAGASLALCGRNMKDLEESGKAIAPFGGKARSYRMDVVDRASIRNAVEAIRMDFGRIDILVNNAGVNIRKPVTELAEEEWDLVLDTNLKGYFLVAQAVVPEMIERRCGKIINIASIMGAVALDNLVAYASSKGGVVQMTKVMAIEWAKHNVNVNAIGPTYFETPLVAALRNDPDRVRFINERTPMGRWGQPEELEGTVIFLASRASDFITGQTIYVDGGWTIW
ncbi:MAG: 2-deoxy-D-gluconate 3-dehydrogenase [Deltaproteobacteria bacterium GWC2_65_14]|nr:MAG: 2-deoxy-D-gluconate 3-dehydrogenase [Deltaproteobacteria bacterium GWC2_65_14]